jgi:hypothetical protein
VKSWATPFVGDLGSVKSVKLKVKSLGYALRRGFIPNVMGYDVFANWYVIN